MGDDATGAFEDFVHGRSPQLFRSALLLCGGDRAHAEDLVQITLERMYRRRRTVFSGGGAPDAYARRVLVNAAIDWRRRLRRRPETALAAAAEPAARDRARDVDDRDLLVRALLTIPPRQRAVLVLRYLEDLPDSDVAAALDCTVGTVKSQAARGLDKMRRFLAAMDEAHVVGQERVDD